MADLNVDVNDYTYEEAHRCYLAYYTNTGSTEMQQKGAAVAESKTWSKFILKWQSEDATIYDLDGEDGKPSAAAQKRINELDEDGADNSKKGNVAGAVAGGAVAIGSVAGALVGAKTAGKIIATNGSLWAAVIYLGTGIIFAFISEGIRSQAKQNRELQERYVKEAEKDLAYNYAAAEQRAEEISNEVSNLSEQAQGLVNNANANVGLSNSVADATVDSNGRVNLAALGQGDAVAGETFDELANINDEMLNTIGEYDEIYASLNTNKSVVNSIKGNMPKFLQQRKNDHGSMMTFEIAGFIGAALGAIGIYVAIAKGVAYSTITFGTMAVAQAVVVALIVVGMAMFGLAAFMAMKEVSNQKTAMQTADDTANKSEEAANNASKASDSIRQKINDSNAAYKNNQSNMDNMDEEDANYNGGPV